MSADRQPPSGPREGQPAAPPNAPATDSRVGPDGRVPLAYLDAGFMDSETARPIRILAEYLHPYETFRSLGVCDTVVFFGSARIRPDGPLGRYYQEARELAGRVARFVEAFEPKGGRFLVCTGGGPGIMEAANRGASEAGGRTIGLNIGLPHEQRPNPYITPELNFEFHYFFMRKLWFAHLARAMVVFPGGFGTMDEMFEILTLSQTRKLDRVMPVLLYGEDHWNSVLSFEQLVRHGLIDAQDAQLFTMVDSVEGAMDILKHHLVEAVMTPQPAFAKSVTPAGTAPAHTEGTHVRPGRPG